MSMKLLITLLSFSLIGCSTPYQASGMMGGFYETQLDENVYTVSFSGNGYTSRNTVANYALLRSAELTLAKGYRYFTIIDKDSWTNTSKHVAPTRTIHNGRVSPYGNITGSSTTYGGEVTVIKKPGSSNTIVMHYSKPQEFSYNAQTVINSLSN